VVGYDVDAQHTTAERVVWIPAKLGVESASFQLPGMVTPWKQASRFLVSIYGTSYGRVLQIHSLLVGWLDLLVGPPMGSVPTGDEQPATIRGSADLSLISYPTISFAGLTLDFLAPLKRTIAFPSAALNGPNDIASAFNTAAVAAALQYRARIVRVGAAKCLEVILPTDPLGTTGATYTLDPNTTSSACPLLGITGSDGGNAVATGTPPTGPYRPGYYVGESEPGPRGGDLQAGGWGAIVPVALYLPIPSLVDVVGVILDTSTDVLATGGDTPDETVVHTP
jgi:hypothetical protein